MFSHLIKAAVIGLATAAPSFAMTLAPVGQPLAVITPTGINSILDNFDFLAPSGAKSVTLNGTVTETYGWDNALGADFSFTSGAFLSPTTLEIGGLSYSYDPSDPFVGYLQEIFGGGAYDFDPFSGDGPGDMVFNFMIFPGYTETFLDPEYQYEYSGILEEFGPRIAPFPEFGLQLSVYLSGPLPTRTFDPATIGAPGTPYDYIEGMLSVDYMTLGLIGGTPIAPVPLPAGLPLLAAALGALGLWRRKARLV